MLAVKLIINLRQMHAESNIESKKVLRTLREKSNLRGLEQWSCGETF